MMTRRVLRWVGPTPSRICDGRFDSLGHGAALEEVRDRLSETHAWGTAQRVPMRTLSRMATLSASMFVKMFSLHHVPSGIRAHETHLAATESMVASSRIRQDA
jgi:hypothetical protein